MTTSLEGAAAGRAAPPGRVPDFFVVGHPKCGTTALYEMLRSHPDIYMPELKETWYFVPELRRSATRSSLRPNDLDEYLALFAGAGERQIAGEATPSYLWSPHAARRIAELAPHARIVAIVREPASFLRSLHMNFVRTHVEDEPDLRTALALEDERRAGRRVPDSYWPEGLLYSEHVRYAEQLRRYFDAFGRERVAVVIYEEFRADNAGTVAGLLRFLGAGEQLAVAPVQANATFRVRSQRVHAMTRSLSMGRDPGSRAAKRAIKALTTRRMRHGAVRQVRRAQRAAPQPVDERLTAELRERYRDEVVALGELLDRDLLGLWGYGSR